MRSSWIRVVLYPITNQYFYKIRGLGTHTTDDMGVSAMWRVRQR